jgi:hypothetical protein
MYWILNAAGEPEPTDDAMVWGLWFKRASKDRSRIVAQDKDERAGAPDVMVSTVFLGLDHSFQTDAMPVLWETLVMGGPLDGEMMRYTSRDAALAGHAAMCRRVQTRYKKLPTKVAQNP